MQRDNSVAYEGYKALYHIGTPVLPELKNLILDTDWTERKYKEISRYLTGIVSLIHDIDEGEAEDIAQDLISNGCPKHVAVQLKSICRFSLKKYINYKIRDIDVFQHRGVKAKCNVQFYIEKWLLNIPEKDLEGIHRIYVARPIDINALGTYTPILFKIVLVWDNSYRERSLLFKLLSSITEKVLYHEVGHHVYRHTFGQDTEQEKEANRYAFNILRQSHPYFAILILFHSITSQDLTSNL